MSCKVVENNKKYIRSVYIGNTSGIIKMILSKYWDWRISLMNDGEILKRYYELTDRTGVATND